MRRPAIPIRCRRAGSGSSARSIVTHPSLPDYTATRAELSKTANDLFTMVHGGKIRIDISKTYPLYDAPQAHADLEARKTTGSIVLVV